MEAIISGTVAVLVFINTLTSEFVYDDNRAILQNQDVLSETSIWTIFKNDFWGTNMMHSGSHKSYRPITILSFRLNYMLSGFNPWSYHLGNVLCHGLATYLFTKLVTSCIFKRRNGEMSCKAMYSGLLFAVHPIHTEAVAGVVGRADILATIFTLTIAIFLQYYAGYDCNICIALLLYKDYCDEVDPDTEDDKNINKIIINEFPVKKKRIKVKKKSPETKKKCHISEVEIKQNNNKNYNKKSLHKETYKTSLQLKKYDKDTDVIKCLKTTRTNIILFAITTCATLSVFSKEQGISALPLCIVYDVWIRNKLNMTSLLIILFKEPRPYKGLRNRIWRIVFIFLVLLAVRILPFISEINNFAPKFSPSDNPAASNSDLLTRILTFNYLVYCNAWVLLCPLKLCYDWSADAIPLVTHMTDPRNLRTLFFYASIAVLFKHIYFTFKDFERQNHNISWTIKDSLHVLYNHLILLWNKYLGRSGTKQAQNLCNVEEVNQEKSEDFRRKVVALLENKNFDYMFSKTEKISESGETVSQSSGYGSEESSKEEEKIPAKQNEEMVPKRIKRRRKAAALKIKKTSHNNLHCVTDGTQTNMELEHLNAIIISCAFMILCFLPASNLFFYVGFVIAERILYLPSVGFCILFVAVTTKIQSKFSNSSALSVGSSKIWANYGYSLKHVGRREEAEDALNNALLKRSNMADVHYNLGLLKQEQMDYGEALKHYNNAIQYRPSLAIAYSNKGTVLAALHKHIEAENIYRDCMKLSDKDLRNPQAHFAAQSSCQYNLGKLLFDRGDTRQAIVELKYALDMNVEKPHSVYNLLGQSSFNIENMDDAEKYFKLSMKTKPDHIQTLLAYGKFHSHMKSHTEAEKLFHLALENDPHHKLALQFYCNFLISQDRQKEAVAVIHRLRNFYPENSAVWLFAAGSYRLCGNLEDAEILYTRYLDKYPQDAHVHMNLGGVFHLQKKYQNAKYQYLLALKHKPDDITTKDNLRKLERVMGKESQ